MRFGRWRLLLAGAAALLLVLHAPALAVAAAISTSSTEPIRQTAQGIEVEVFGDVIVGRPVEIELRAANPVQDASQGSITVSLPGNPTVEIVRSSAGGARIYQPGDQMYNFGAGRAAPISVQAVELFVGSWPAGGRHVLRIRVTASDPYSVQARASFKRANGSFVHLPATGQVDQQGAPTRLIDIAPKPASQPTSPPAPPTQAPPRPTQPPTRPPAPKPTQSAPSPVPARSPAVAKPAQPSPAPAQSPVAAGPAGGATATPRPPADPTQPPASTAPAGDGPSMPMLLAGFGIMAVGLAIGLIALVLVLRRRSDAPRTGTYAGPAGGYPPQGPQYGPTGTAPFAGGAGSAPYSGYGAPPGPPPPPWEQHGPQQGSPPGGWTGQTGGPAAPRTPPWQTDSSGWGAAPTADERASGTPQPPGRPPDADAGWGQHGTPHPPGGPAGGPGAGAGAGAPGTTPSPGERYTRRQLMGRGGMGSVYRAYDSRLRRWVALKIMHADLGLQPGFIDRFVREAQVAAMLEHPNIVTVYDIEPVGDSIQMVMSWIDGEDLQKVLEREGPLPVDRAARLLDQMAAALDHAHLREHPVLHRDIKPSNIMIGPNERAILTDFGIARLMGDVSLTQAGQMVGTPAFMAPEVIQGEEADGRADVYALGVVLYQMLTGRAPFRAETPLALLHAQVHTPPVPPRSVAPGLPPAVDGVLMRALAKDRTQRFQTAGALARAFRSSIGMG